MQFNTIVTDHSYGRLNPMQFGYQQCHSTHFFGPAIRTYWLIHFVISGSGHYRIGNKSYTVSPGEMFVIPPYEETYYEADNQSPWNYIWIGFTSDGPLPVALDNVIRCPEALNIFIKMKECNNLDGGRSAFLTARLWDLFALLMENEPHRPDCIENALDCIHSEYMNNITIDEIARRVNLNRMYFSTLFKKRIGLSPKQYLFNYRMNIAATLIKDKNVSVSVAASSVGYTDIFTFSKMFKKHFGIAPSHYAAEQKSNPIS